MAMANSMPMGMKDISIALKDTTNATLGIRSVFIFDEKLRTAANKDLRWATKYYEDEFHGSVPLLGYYDALKFFFDFYMRPSFQTLTDSTGIILENHFKMVSERLGYEILPSESELAGLAWRSWAMEGNFGRALIFLELYMKLYPESAGAHTSMGQYFRGKGDEESANTYFKKARELSERE